MDSGARFIDFQMLSLNITNQSLPEGFAASVPMLDSGLTGSRSRVLMDKSLPAECICRWLPAAGLVWRRAAPTLRIRDPHKEEKMAAIHEALAKCSAGNLVFYEDEVDIHLNPKIGADWQLRGQQKRIVTPGQNEKYYLAGALHSATGKVSYIGGNSKGSSLFIRLLKHLKSTYRRAKTITLIVDNNIIHKSRETLRWLKANPKFRVIYQSVYSPWVNQVEWLWHAIHETIN